MVNLFFQLDLIFTQDLQKKNIEKRIKRHFSKKKNLHWHIDYLLNNDAVKIINTKKSQMTECNLNKKTKGTIIIDGFGSSDRNLSCQSHLKFIEN